MLSKIILLPDVVPDVKLTSPPVAKVGLFPPLVEAEVLIILVVIVVPAVKATLPPVARSSA